MSVPRETGLDRSQDPLPAQFDAGKVRAQLALILASSHFKNSRRCQTLLKYVVESACEGRIEDLKERVVGSSVFGRDADYDTNQDAVVRNAAAEVRKRLAQYYMECNPGDTLRIDLPIGSYAPEIRSQAPAAPVARRRMFGRISAGVAVVLLGLVAVVALLAWRGGSFATSELDRFWAPLASTPGVVQVCVGQSRLLYYPVPPPLNAQGELDLKANLPVSSLRPMRDRFMHSGDAICLSRITAYLQSRGKGFRFRGALTTPYAELRGLPIVLIGAFNNEWNMRLTKGLRFSLSSDPRTFAVNDGQSPSNPVFSISRGGITDWDVEVDYALVTRVFDPNTENWVIAAGGFTAYGTMMAGDFLSNATYFREAIRSAPPGWAKKNMQIVLQVKVVESTPGPPKVMATHFW